jgi:hypothetical protein
MGVAFNMVSLLLCVVFPARARQLATAEEAEEAAHHHHKHQQQQQQPKKGAGLGNKDAGVGASVGGGTGGVKQAT